MAIVVRYKDDPTLWHERRLLWKGAEGHFWLVTPDREVIHEDLQCLKTGDIDRWRDVTKGLPASIDPSN
eukprot:5649404-Karenia_brevis.AAC.1